MANLGVVCEKWRVKDKDCGSVEVRRAVEPLNSFNSRIYRAHDFRTMVY
jgi:hypothetical protein